MNERLAAQSASEAGLLLVGHGTRSKAGQAEVFELAERIAALAAPLAVEVCFLELASPAISEGVRRLAQRGVRQIRVVPLLLFAAGHAKRDIPRALADALGSFPAAWTRRLSIAPHFGCHEKILELSAERYREALAGHDPMPVEQTLLVMVGRGSSDDEATAEMLRFAELRRRRTPVAGVETCFLAVARPRLDEALAKAARSDFRRVVVQPHLLFGGELVDEVGRRARAYAARDAVRHWVIAPHLGPAPLLAEAVLEIAGTLAPHTV